MADVTTSDRALELADKWAQQIGQKMSDVAPGAADIAVEAVQVKIGAAFLQWILLAIFFSVAISLFVWSFKRMNAILADKEQENDNAFPYFLSVLASGVVGFVLMLNVMISFPSREIVGMFAPRGYVALMVFDSVSTPKK